MKLEMKSPPPDGYGARANVLVKRSAFICSLSVGVFQGPHREKRIAFMFAL